MTFPPIDPKQKFAFNDAPLGNNFHLMVSILEILEGSLLKPHSEQPATVADVCEHYIHV